MTSLSTMRHRIVSGGVAAALLILLVALLAGCVNEEGGHHYPPPEQPDPAIAQGIEDALSSQPGVAAVDVLNEKECIDGCKGWRPKYLADVTLAAGATPEQIVEIVTAHDSAATQIAPAWRRIVLTAGEGRELTIHPVHDGFAATHATAFQQAAAASPELTARFGRTEWDEGPILLSLEARVPDLPDCSGLDAAMTPVVPALGSAAAMAGGAEATVAFNCGMAYGHVAIPAGAVFQPGWSNAAALIDAFYTKHHGGGFETIVQDLYLSAYDGATVLTVEVNGGRSLSDADKKEIDAIIASLAIAGAGNPTADIKQF